ncbi:hypothetical protein L479_02700 [Exiguobacterium sp. S17]|nr:hypothetical protein L479_02700 [Exiguobacterium sp. S17]
MCTGVVILESPFYKKSLFTYISVHKNILQQKHEVCKVMMALRGYAILE